MKRSTVLTLLIATWWVSGQDTIKVGHGNYLIFPIRTELQRSVLYRGAISGGHRHTVLINGDAAVRNDGGIDAKAIDLEGLQRALRDVRDPWLVGDQKRAFSISVLYYKGRPKEEARRLLYWALIGLAHEAGYENVSVGTIFNSWDSWQRALNAVKLYGLPKQEKAEENGIGNAAVQVYPVRTALSQYDLDGANCLVALNTPLDAKFRGLLKPGEEEVIAKSVLALKLPMRGKVTFHVYTRPESRKAVQRFHDGTAKDLAKKLGFHNYSTRTVDLP